MPWQPIVGYRMRFDTSKGTGDIVLYHVDDGGVTQTTQLNNLAADRFTAMALLLTNDKDHKLVFDGWTIDAGPEKP